MFSDGRQCTMARSDIHPSLCTYHSEREEQLFGTPHTQGSVRGPSFDLPELFSASHDLTTAAGVNRALGQVFRLLAQRRISRQEAATFGKLAHLLLQSIRAAHAEADVAPAESLAADFGLAEHQRERNAQTVSPAANSPASPLPPAASPESLSPSATVNNLFEMSASAASIGNSPEINRYKNVELNPVQNEHLRKKSTRENGIRQW
jgi:hypothetical protein